MLLEVSIVTMWYIVVEVNFTRLGYYFLNHSIFRCFLEGRYYIKFYYQIKMKCQITIGWDINEEVHTFKGLKLWTFQSKSQEEPTVFKFVNYEIVLIAPFASKLPLRMTAMTIRKKFREDWYQNFLRDAKIHGMI